MSESVVETPVVEAPAAPVAVDLGSYESVAEYRAARDGKPVAVAPVSPAAAAEGTTSADVAAVAEGDPAAGAPATPAEGTDPAAEAGRQLAKRKGSLQARIDEMAAAKGAAERKAAALEAELARVRGGGAPAAPVTPAAVAPATAPAAAAPATAPAPESPTLAPGETWSGKPKPAQADFQDYDVYRDAVAEWQLDERDARTARIEQDRALRAHAEQAQAAYRERYQAARAEHADFDAVMQSAVDLPITEQMEAHITHVDAGVQIAYFLAQNRAECERIAKLPPALQIAALGKIEGKLEAARQNPAPSGPVVPTVPQTQAPAPVKPAASGGSVAAAGPPDPSKINSVAEWRRLRSSGAIR